MSTYIETAEATSKLLTKSYSTSFSMASKLFANTIKADIYNIYGFVRLADEIVDSYCQADAKDLLNDLESETYAAIKRGYSTNLIIESFQKTANDYGIGKDLISPFFRSMGRDLHYTPFTKKAFNEYVYGSAEVVGLMCLKVFTKDDVKLYELLAPKAQRLGSAYQKINFLRDMADDYNRLGRYYFPYNDFDSFNEKTKVMVIDDIKADLKEAKSAIDQLPANSQLAVSISYRYFNILLTKLERTPVEIIKQQRIRISNGRKILILAHVALGNRVNSS